MSEPSRSPTSLDPADWSELRAQGRRMLDDMFDHLEHIAEEPLWRDPETSPRPASTVLPRGATALAQVHGDFLRQIRPYSSGNGHPGFMGWVQGGGSAVGMLAEMLAAGLNANLGGRNHMPARIEQEVIAWTRELFGFPSDAFGLLCTGASQANHIGVLAARTRALGREVRHAGLGSARLVAYASTATHGCLARALQMAGLGEQALRLIPTDAGERMATEPLAAAIERDRADGRRPFLLVGNAGTVNVGGIDPLAELAGIARAHGMHFHVDGAFGALGVLSPSVSPRLAGLEQADTIAFDWHKWGQVPYDAGCILARDGRLLHDTFSDSPAYLERAGSGLAAGERWACDYGPDLSRSFRALKVWFTLRTYGTDALAGIVEESCRLARHLSARVAATPELEVLAPVPLNIVNFGWRGGESEGINRRIVEALHEEGRVAPSLTTVDGRSAIRAAFVNHRTRREDADVLVESVLRIGRRLTGSREAA